VHWEAIIPHLFTPIPRGADVPLHQTLERWWQGGHPPWWGGLLLPASHLYGWIAHQRNRRYDRHPPSPLEGVVVSIGNITVGGSGKTPVTIDLTRHLQKRGLKVVVVSRGYGGSGRGEICLEDLSPTEQATVGGDEPTLIHRSTGAPVVVGAQRAAACRLALRRYRPDLIVLDDALQHRAVHRDLNVVVVGRSGWGNGHYLPAGPLREPVVDALARCDWVVHFGPLPPDCTGLPATAAATTAGPWCDGNLTPCPPPPSGTTVTLYSAIAQPERVVATLAQQGIGVAARITQRDHAHPGPRQWRAIDQRPTPLWVTTAKDAVRLPPERQADPALKVVTLELIWDPSPLIDQIAHRVASRSF